MTCSATNFPLLGATLRPGIAQEVAQNKAARGSPPNVSHSVNTLVIDYLSNVSFQAADKAPVPPGTFSSQLFSFAHQLSTQNRVLAINW